MGPERPLSLRAFQPVGFRPDGVNSEHESHTKGGGYGMKVELRESESFEGLLRRFTKEMQKSGKLREFRSKRRFVSKSEQRRAKIRKAEHKRRRKEATGR
jgi:small subunit ribosomal protein S21